MDSKLQYLNNYFDIFDSKNQIFSSFFHFYVILNQKK